MSDSMTPIYIGGQAAGSHFAKGAVHSFMYVMIIHYNKPLSATMATQFAEAYTRHPASRD